ncbi:hypothetical protein [Streptomyces sp. NPDC005573]|uniref:hypothetical protein n=1 Tax=Streptomyces sp. NPDC005573 TaxID=3156890 RepID=UPI0033BBAD6B
MAAEAGRRMSAAHVTPWGEERTPGRAPEQPRAAGEAGEQPCAAGEARDLRTKGR